MRRRRGRERWVTIVLVAVLGAALAACSGGEGGGSGSGAKRTGKLTLFTDSYALAYFAERIAGDRASVSFPAPAGADPSFWKPDAETIAEYQRADLILINGAGFATWIDTATLPGSRVIDTSAALADQLLPLEGAVTHSHGGMGEHSHSGYATRLWLDPTLAIAQATAIASALAGVKPEDGATFEANLAALKTDLEALDAKLAALAGRIGATPLLFSHPVYAYFIRRYSLNARSLHWEPTETPGHFAMAQFDEKTADHSAKLLVWEAEPLPETKTMLEERGIRSVVFAPLAEAPASGDYLSAMNENLARLEAHFPAT